MRKKSDQTHLKNNKTCCRTYAFVISLAPGVFKFGVAAIQFYLDVNYKIRREITTD